MSRQIIIETPFPTLEETAHALGVSVARAKRVERMLGEHKATRRLKANGRVRRAAKYAAKRASKKA